MGLQVEIRNLRKQHDSKTALQVPLLTLVAGHLTMIMGANGSGKTTMLRIVAGLDHQYAGEVRYDGRPWRTAPQREITLVLQKSYLLRRSVYDNIAFPLQVRGLGRDERRLRIAEVLSRLEISHLQQRHAQSLSAGETQKVSLARAIVFAPQLLLLDEPTANLDAASAQTMEREIVRFHDETSATVIWVTHDMQQTKRLGQNVVCLCNGKVENNHGISQGSFRRTSETEDR